MYLFIYLLLCIIKSRQTREMKYNTKRIAEVQKNKNILTNKNKQNETQYKLSIQTKLSKIN